MMLHLPHNLYVVLFFPQIWHISEMHRNHVNNKEETRNLIFFDPFQAIFIC